MLFAVLLAALVSSSPDAVSAQTIDAGRGELPLVVPSDYDPGTPLPLVVLLHGYGSSGARQEAYMRFGALADSHQFLLVNPDGTEESGGENRRFWNASEACCNFMRSTVDDSAYVMSIVDAVKAQYSIDPKRVYLIGHSNGGFMSYRTAYDHSDTIAAIASIAGAASTDEPPAPSNPVHVLQIHGTADTVIAYEGGSFQGGPRHPGAREDVEAWARHNGCAAGGVATGTLDLDRGLDDLETEVTRYTAGCKAGGSAELWTINGGGHGPAVSDHFSRLVVEWLLGHPKP